MSSPRIPQEAPPSARIVYVWRLIVTLPDGCDAPGWRPTDYDNSYGWYDDDTKPFRWPRRRMYLSSDAAHRRAHMMRRWGATVDVQQSEAVSWPS